MRKRVLLMLACLVFVSLFVSCAYTPHTFDMPWAYDEDTEAAQSPSETEEPQETGTTPAATASAAAPAPSETPALSETPAPSQTPDAPAPEKVMLFEREDREYIKSLWPFKKCTINDFGTVSNISAMWYKDAVYITLDIETGKPYKKLNEQATDFISGSWKEEKGGAIIEDGRAEGMRVDCIIMDMDTYRNASFTFKLEGSFDKVSDIIDGHCPEGVVDLPEEFLGKPYSKYAAITDNTIYVSREWDFAEYRETFESLKKDFAGEEGFEYYLESSESGERFVFTRGEVTVYIGVSEEYGYVTVAYEIHPHNYSIS